ncbi:endonuclease DDE [Candidatus Nitromaritima sp. SCGC AAA799-A02]|nr:endonuclease DDE [Candidatus Nitromaritima sp. SCGC AAA799-C22]KMP11014.1 endonuclease DDE [Candidatus Nitromaritima sp. SCGC AAA799-A02]
MSRIASPIILTLEERTVLKTWERGRRLPYRKVVRAKIVLMAANGICNQDIAATLRVSRPTVQLWRERFLALRLSGLEKDAPRPGRKTRIPAKKVRAIIDATLHTTPPHETHWSTRSMAKAQGLSQATIQRIWKQHNLKPHLFKTFKLSRDKDFVEKLRDIVGLYLNPPDKALVLCVDEKSQIQALDRTQPGRPLKKGRCGTMTHDYKRHGTTTLFAALNTLDGKVIGDCMPRHRHQEFIRFLKKIDNETPAEFDLHLIVDNYGTHKHPRVHSWLQRHPRFHLHFTPTSSSWLNLVERWFRELTDKRIRRGSFHNVPALITAINDYLNNHNQNPKIFVWSAPVERILNKIAKCKEALDSLH